MSDDEPTYNPDILMTYDPTKPNAAQSPSLAPSQIQPNWQRIQTIVTADHQFNVSAAGNDGFHKKVSLLNQNLTSVPANSNVAIYSDASNLSTGTSRSEVFVRGSNHWDLMACRAAVSFTVSGSFVVSTIFSHNINSVVRDGVGLYTINFFSNMPTDRYCALGMAQSPGGSSGARMVGYREGATRASSQDISLVRIQVYNSSGNNTDPVLCSVFIFGG